MHLTNMPTRLQGWKHAPCFALGTTEVPATGHIMLDYESDNGVLENGPTDPDYGKAVSRGLSELIRFRNLTRARIAWYGWPYPRHASHVEPFAKHFDQMVSRADWLAPTCYVSGSGGEVERGKFFREAAIRMMVKSKPCYGCISDWDIGTSRVVTDDEWVTQCKAARAAGSHGVYLWTGMEWRVWAAKKFDSADAGVRHNAAKAWAELLGMWDFTGEQTEENIDAQRLRVCRKLIEKAEWAWRMSK